VFKCVISPTKSFDCIKENLITAHVLQDPIWDIPFHVHIDASDKEIGEILGQQEDKIPYAIYFINKNLSSEKLNYTVTEKEFIAIVYTINKFRQ
jgi:hypothetical protein